MAAKFSQIEAKVLFASASSKQKRVPLSACSIHQSILLPRAMRDAFCTQLIQLPAVGSYNQTIGFQHGNTSEGKSNNYEYLLFLKVCGRVT